MEDISVKYSILALLLVFISSVFASTWTFPGISKNIDIIHGKIVRSIEIYANDAGGDSVISLTVDGKTLPQKKIRNIGSISWRLNRCIDKASISVKNDVSRIKKIKVHYIDEKNKKNMKELAKSFSLPYYNDLDKTFTLEKELGDTHFLFLFFSSSCRNCAAEMPRFSKVAPKYPNVKFIGIHYKGIPQQVAEFVEEYGVQFDCLYDKDGVAFKSYGIKYIPYALLVNRKGEIVAQGNLKLEEVEKLMDGLSKIDLNHTEK